jgi:parallel beta-helix repeat protein
MPSLQKISVLVLYLLINYSHMQAQNAVTSPGSGNETKDCTTSIYFISPAGNNTTGDGSLANPWLTFEKGISVLTPGDTLFALNGTYTERVLVPSSINGTSSCPVTIIEKPGEEVKICHTLAQIVRINGSYINFIGFEIYDLTTNEGDDQGLIVMETAHHILLSDLDVHDFDSHGIDIHGDNVTVKNCTIHDGVLDNENNAAGASGWGSGLKVSYGSDGAILTNNTIYNNWGEGIAVTRGTNAQVSDNTVYNNFSVNIYIDNSTDVEVFRNFSYNTESPLGGDKTSGISIAEEYYTGWGNHLQNITIKNNVVYNCSRGFMFYGTDSGTGGMKNVLVANNVFYLTDNSSSVIYISREPEDDMTFCNNIIRSNPSSVRLVYWTSTVVGSLDFNHNFWVNGPARFWNDDIDDWDYSPGGTGDISETDPLFTGTPGTQPYVYSPGIFTFQNNSPAIEAGLNLTSDGVVNDYEEISRPQGIEFDMGSHEYEYNMDLIISEVTDPSDNANARFVELYNAGQSAIDFDTDTWYLGKQNNGSAWSDIQLTGTVAAGETFVISYGNDFSNFYSAFGFNPDMYNQNITGDGDDGYFLYFRGNHNSGTLMDAYGALDTDGTGQLWEYTDSRAVRQNSVTAPNATWTASEWNITNSTASATGPASHGNFTTWSGKSSEAWGTTTNWSGGVLPSSSTNVKIIASATNFPSVSVAATCNNILIESGSSLVGVDNLTVNGTATVHQEIQGFSSDSDGWNLIGCPMSDMAMAGSGFVSGTYDFYSYSEETNTWLNQEDPANEALFTNFTPGIGYLAAYESTGTKSFSGSLNNANVTVSGLTKINDGWHILSNPFPSGLDWATGWTLTNVGATAQILKADGTGYRVLTAGDDIPANQGFWVQVSTAPGGVTIPVSAATHSSQSFSTKSGQQNNLTLRLFIDHIRNVETRIIFNKNAGDGFDWGYDAHYLPPLGNDIPQFYSYISEDKLALNSFNFINNKSIALGTEVKKVGTFQLYADGLSSFSSNVSIILEDTRNNELFDFRKQNPVNVEILPADKHGRYLLHFATGDPGFADIQVYSYANCIYINNTGNEALRADISICNILGQDIWHKEIDLTGVQMFTLNVAKSIIIVKINTGNKIVTRKVFIN